MGATMKWVQRRARQRPLTAISFAVLGVLVWPTGARAEPPIENRADAVAHEQSPEQSSEAPLKTDPDWLDYVAPAALLPVWNVVYWLPSYSRGSEFAQINLTTMRGGIAHGWVFDEDRFTTNQFGHPYQGNTYFNTARIFGLSFWESAPYVALGSLMWEYLMESGQACCYPSINDFLITTLGGIAVGEVSWRLSNAVLDDSTSGGERFAREAAALVINPPFGVYRLISGDAFTAGYSATSRHSVWGELSTGGSLFGSGPEAAETNISNFAWISRLRLRQGHVRELGNDFAPFDHFTLDLSIGISGGEVAGSGIDILGLTNGYAMALGSVGRGIVGFGLDFDFFENVLVSLGQTSFGPMFIAEWSLRGPWSLFGRVFVAPSFGAISTDYPDIREYNFGPGATLRSWVELRHSAWGEVYVKVDRYWLHTVSGNEGDEFAGVLDTGGTARLTDSLGIGAHVIFSDKFGRYAEFPNTRETIFFGEGYIAWVF